MTPLFEFRMRPLPQIIQGWEAINFDVPRYLSGWFWLTDGWYWLTTPQGDIPTGHPDFETAFGLEPSRDPHLDYQVARFWQDLIDVSHDSLEPLPEPFAGWVESGRWEIWWEQVNEWWRSTPEDDPLTHYRWDDWYEAGSWWSARHLDMGYLQAPPVIRFWRIGDEVTVQWDTQEKRVDGVLCWVESCGRLNLSGSQFQGELEDFRHRLDLAMRERLSEVEKLGVLDAAKLASLHRQHTASIEEEGRTGDKVDWLNVLSAIRKLEQWSVVPLPR
ncbi:DUF5984 family protein [Deinococcus sp. YIM 134068]|uniref:DUF5984 family protein n=1 Tax=Deinococcus lichenicola TaxID=3118910 RepID=UPI002F9210F6